MTSDLTYGGAVGPDGVAEDESLYASYKLQYERDWQRKIRDQLSMIPGVIVNVNVELSPGAAALHHVGQARSQAGRSELERIEPRNDDPASPITAGGPEHCPTASGNQPVAVTTAGTGTGESTSNESRSDQQNVAGHEQVVSSSAPLVPKKVTASIDVPASYYAEVWRQRNPAARRPAAEVAGLRPSWRRSKPKRPSAFRRPSATCCRR